MKTNRILHGILWATICNLAALAAVTLALPDQIPIHMDALGRVDAMGPRWAVPLFGLIPLLLALGMLLYRRLTQSNPHTRANRRVENIVFGCLGALFLLLSWLPPLVALTGGQDASRLLPLLVGIPFGLLFVVLGNYMGTVRPNHYLGLRVKWTLASAEVWRRTHRMGSYWQVGAGLVLLAGSVAAFFAGGTVWLLAAFCAALLMAVAVPTWYAWRLYHRLQIH